MGNLVESPSVGQNLGYANVILFQKFEELQLATLDDIKNDIEDLTDKINRANGFLEDLMAHQTGDGVDLKKLKSSVKSINKIYPGLIAKGKEFLTVEELNELKQIVHSFTQRLQQEISPKMGDINYVMNNLTQIADLVHNCQKELAEAIARWNSRALR